MPSILPHHLKHGGRVELRITDASTASRTRVFSVVNTNIRSRVVVAVNEHGKRIGQGHRLEIWARTPSQKSALTVKSDSS
jgi:hypothetical protein